MPTKKTTKKTKTTRTYTQPKRVTTWGGTKYIITKTKLREVGRVSVKFLTLADLLYGDDLNLKYTVYYMVSDLTGQFPVDVSTGTMVSGMPYLKIGCQRFVGANARKILSAAKRAKKAELAAEKKQLARAAAVGV